MAQFSLRIVDADFYVAKPLSTLVESRSEFTGSKNENVPVIRIFGATPAGQKTCLHVHQVYPYFYVPIQEGEANSEFSRAFAKSLDFALHMSLGKPASSMKKYIAKVELVKRIPFYGYYNGEKDFLRVLYYSPYLTRRISELLLSGTILNRVFQPHETHVPYLLQFFIDFNLYGMNMINLSSVKFRKTKFLEKPLTISDESKISEITGTPEMSPPLALNTSFTKWNVTTIVKSDLLPAEILPQSTCELEVDCLSSDILNKFAIQASIGSNPGLDAIWQDEKQRCRQRNESSQISIQESQARQELELLEIENCHLNTVQNAIKQRLEGGETVSPSQSTPPMALKPNILQNNTQSVTPTSLLEREDSLIRDSQMADILANLGSFSDDESQSDDDSSVYKDYLSTHAAQQEMDNDKQEEEEESMVMSQQVFDDVDIDEQADEDPEKLDDDFSESWSASIIHHIPQLDGSNDTDSSRNTERLCSSRSQRSKPYTRFRKQTYRISKSLSYQRSYLPDPLAVRNTGFNKCKSNKIPQLDGSPDTKEPSVDSSASKQGRPKKRRRTSRKVSLNFKIEDSTKKFLHPTEPKFGRQRSDNSQLCEPLVSSSCRDFGYNNEKILPMTTYEKAIASSSSDSPQVKSACDQDLQKEHDTPEALFKFKQTFNSNIPGLLLADEKNPSTFGSESLFNMGYLSPEEHRREVVSFPNIHSPSDNNPVKTSSPLLPGKEDLDSKDLTTKTIYDKSSPRHEDGDISSTASTLILKTGEDDLQFHSACKEYDLPSSDDALKDIKSGHLSKGNSLYCTQDQQYEDGTLLDLGSPTDNFLFKRSKQLLPVKEENHLNTDLHAKDLTTESIFNEHSPPLEDEGGASTFSTLILQTENYDPKLHSSSKEYEICSSDPALMEIKERHIRKRRLRPCTQARRSSHGSIYRFAAKPPIYSDVKRSAFKYGLGDVNHEDAFYGKASDASEKSVRVGRSVLKVNSRMVQDLPVFTSGSLCNEKLSALQSSFMEYANEANCVRNNDGIQGMDLYKLRERCMGEKRIVLTPARTPPKPRVIRSWLEAKQDTKRLNESRHVEVEPKLSSDYKTTQPSENFIQPRKETIIEDVKDVNLENSHTHQVSKSRLKRPKLLNLKISEEKERGSCTPGMSPIEGKRNSESGLISPPLFFSPDENITRSSSMHEMSFPYASTPVRDTSVVEVKKSENMDSCESSTISRSRNSITTAKSIKEPLRKRSSNVALDLRRQIIQGGNASHPGRSPSTTSQIEGPSPNNTFAFKITQVNFQDAKALHEMQYLTKMSLEVHVQTRRNFLPDPEIDSICACFYCILEDSNEKDMELGILVVDYDSYKEMGQTEASSSRISEADISGATYLSVNTTKTSSTGRPETRPLLCRSGVTENCVVKYFEHEEAMLIGLSHLVRDKDPDILMGYEIEMLSWGYIIHRAAVLNIDLCPLLSRTPHFKNGNLLKEEPEDELPSLFLHLVDIKIPGRILLDVWRIMRLEVTLNIYSFENVAYHVLHERIPSYTHRMLSDWWDHKTSLVRWRTVRHYIRRCRGNIQLLERLDFINRTSELARLFGILFYAVISRGSQFRVESMMLRIAKPMGLVPVSPGIKQRAQMAAPECIPLVMEPESRFYVDPVLVLDFQSLYPSIIIAYNYCFSTCLGRVRYFHEPGDFPFGAVTHQVDLSTLKKLEKEIHVSPNGVAFVKKNIRRGILPRMLEGILKTRVMVKTAMKKYKDDKTLHRMLDARQLGLKLIANVTFGYTAANFSGRMPCTEIGDTVVRKARETLENAIEMVNSNEKWHAKVVYGDTDSMFVLLKGASKERAFAVAKEIVEAVTKVNPKPIKLKFEKVYYPCVLQTKKRYVGYMYEQLDQKDPVYDAKGIETVRRDNCAAVGKILEKSIRTLFETKDVSLVKRFVQRQFVKIMEGKVSIQDFTFAKEYRGLKNYKPGACVPSLELTRRRLANDKRSEPRIGERVPYVITYGSPGLPLIQLVRQPDELFKDSNLRLNGLYYITKQILPPLQRLFSLIGADVTTWYADLPKVSRVTGVVPSCSDTKKGTISQYFTSMNCLICKELTRESLCQNCLSDPQSAVIALSCRLQKTERRLKQLTDICNHCAGFNCQETCCVSLDCPVLHRHFRLQKERYNAVNIRQTLANVF